MSYEWAIVLGGGLASLALRWAPELWLRDRQPPTLIADALPWLPVTVAGTMAGLLHLGAAPELRLEYLAAAAVGSLSLLWRRSFYLPLFLGALTLALWRHFG